MPWKFGFPLSNLVEQYAAIPRYLKRPRYIKELRPL